MTFFAQIFIPLWAIKSFRILDTQTRNLSSLRFFRKNEKHFLFLKQDPISMQSFNIQIDFEKFWVIWTSKVIHVDYKVVDDKISEVISFFRSRNEFLLLLFICGFMAWRSSISLRNFRFYRTLYVGLRSYCLNKKKKTKIANWNGVIKKKEGRELYAKPRENRKRHYF